MLYGRQEIRVLSRGLGLASANWVCDSFRCFVNVELSVHFRLHTPQSDAR